MRTELGLIVAREIRLRLLSRAALIGVGVSVLVIAGLVFFPRMAGNGTESDRVAVLGLSAGETARAAVLLPDNDVVAGTPGAKPTEDTPFVVAVTDRGIEATAWKSSRLGELETVTSRVQLAALSVGPEASRTALSLSAVHDDSDRVARTLIAYVVVMLLFARITTMSSAVTQALMEEKMNRVVDLLLPKVRPLSLLWGKVIGAGTVGLVQTCVMGAAALGMLLAAGDRTHLDIVVGVAGVAVVWYLLGFLFLGALYGGVGAMMSRPDDVPAVTVPLQMVSMLTVFANLAALQAPGARWADVLSTIPPFSATLVPLRYTTGEESVAGMALSAGVILGCALLLSMAGARLFTLAVRADSAGEAVRRFFTTASRRAAA
ncbi:hypothetical protein D7294_30880 [Streptomyces hoynatensis]|uniref:ABC-2 type transporter transmembrane domain-containing protein n=1 Tax=Streptomyces hoynatensis TaxID=1141874 RepID=A0A3A9YF25_9ACTN|nr:hypothetical protein D7294_30880 [Streptomyces hoynatensis]